jgi:adenylosuccinate lyase
MPGKVNPIKSERVCGLARIARGHFYALSQVSGLWEDRDLSNSSTERIAVAELAATVEYMVNTMAEVFQDLIVNKSKIAENADDPRTRANANQNQIQKQAKVGPIEASNIASTQAQGVLF